MEQVFAPWRMEWVERDARPGDPETTDDEADDGTTTTCPFCALPERGEDRETRIVARSPHAFVLLNNYPYNPGHVMVIPYAHGGDYAALSDAQIHDHARLKARTVRAIEHAMTPDGINAGLNLGGAAAGGSIDDHVHTHVVPRWSGDTDFMAVTADTKVIVEGLADSYEKLHTAFAEQAGADRAPTGAVRVDGAPSTSG